MWGYAFRARQFAKGSLWLVPLAGALVGIVLGILAVNFENDIATPRGLQYSSGTASVLLSSVVGSTAALTGFVVTVSVLVVQMAIGTFSARYMRLWYRDGLLKATLAVLVGTMTFSFTLLRHVEENFVPNLGITLAGIFLFLGVLLFLLFLDRFLHRLRPVAVASLVADAGRLAFTSTPTVGTTVAPEEATTGEPSLQVSSTRAGAIQAIDAAGLVRWAVAHDCVLILQQAVGDFVPTGRVLVDVHGSVANATAAGRTLRNFVSLGVERTVDQDVGFAIRIMVDIANRALSPAVNDPTTAVQVMDHLEELLRLLGTESLERRGELRDSAGRIRVLVPTQNWEDILTLAVTEIRRFGAASIQVVRRLRTLLDGLHESVLAEYRPAVENELARLDATVQTQFGGTVDLDLALRPDRQGIGGPHSGARV